VEEKRALCVNAIVNLSEKTVDIFETPEEIIRRFVGGRGLNMYYLYKYLKPQADPLSPDNVLILGTGLLTGTLAPNSGRHNVTCKSPESGIIGDANIGGFLGPEMRFAGFDRLIILGKSDKPVYLYLEDGKIEIRDASDYWGLLCSETDARFHHDLGSDVEVQCIGPAGENLVRFGDYQMARQLIFDIAYRRGLGDTLAEGSRLVEKFGPETADFLIAIKGLPQSDPHDVRYLKGFALGIATSSRGADHLRSRPTLEILDLPASFTTQLYGAPVDPNPTSYESKSRVVHFSETIYAVVDCMGICKFICHGFNSPRNLNYEHFCELSRLATGLEFSREELQSIGRRVIDQERLINYQEKGITRKDDTLPGRYFDEPMPSARAKGSYISREGFNKMLDEYYDLCGWDNNGMLPQERITELNKLRDLAEQ